MALPLSSSPRGDRIAELVEDLNTPMRRYRASRRDLFEKLEVPVLKPLPATRFSYGEWKKARVNIDCHVVFDDHFYSSPYQMVGEEVWIRTPGLTIEIFTESSELRRDNRVGAHLRSYKPGRHTTSATSIARCFTSSTPSGRPSGS